MAKGLPIFLQGCVRSKAPFKIRMVSRVLDGAEHQGARANLFSELQAQRNKPEFNSCKSLKQVLAWGWRCRTSRKNILVSFSVLTGATKISPNWGRAQDFPALQKPTPQQSKIFDRKRPRSSKSMQLVVWPSQGFQRSGQKCLVCISQCCALSKSK